MPSLPEPEFPPNVYIREGASVREIRRQMEAGVQTFSTPTPDGWRNPVFESTPRESANPFCATLVDHRRRIESDQKIVIAIHGILNRVTEAEWPDALQLQLCYKWHLPVNVRAEHYWGGPFPRLMHRIVNPLYAKGLAARVKLIEDARSGEIPVCVVAHSNGTNIAVRMAEELAAEGIRIETMILIGSALNSDVRKSGIDQLMGDDRIGRVIAYCSREDNVTRPLEWIPGLWGSLGAKGFRRGRDAAGLHLEGANGKQLIDWSQGGPVLVTRWFPDYGHGGYFDGDRIVSTFELIAQDLRLPWPGMMKAVPPPRSQWERVMSNVTLNPLRHPDSPFELLDHDFRQSGSVRERVEVGG